MNAKIAALEADKAICHSILDDVYRPTTPINVMTPQVRDKINYLFGHLNEIERQIVIETEISTRSFWKKLTQKK
jgi:hypothetical protein